MLRQGSLYKANDSDLAEGSFDVQQQGPNCTWNMRPEKAQNRTMCRGTPTRSSWNTALTKKTQQAATVLGMCRLKAG